MSAYVRITKRQRRLNALGGAMAQLHWDQAAMMPAGGANARAEQLATLSVLSHELSTSPEVADLIDMARSEDLRSAERVNLELFERSWQRAILLPVDLVDAMSRAESETERVWRNAKEESDFSQLAEPLNNILNLVRQQADIFADAFSLSRYDALLDLYDRGRRSQEVDRHFEDLASFLPDLLEQVKEKQASETIQFPVGPFPIDQQKQLGQTVMSALGFSFANGRLDTSAHPFTGGTPDDVRLTTRYDEEDFTKGLMGVIHETGHALYEQGLPEDLRGLCVGDSQGMTIHESQSLFFEMQMGRSPAFLKWLSPIAGKQFGKTGPEWTHSNLSNLYARVEPGFIRVDADEVTYPLHVILRYRLEQSLLSGDLLVKDLPGAWNDGMKSLLGVTVTDDALGCLQDIHWPSGAFGYFPTYTLGAMLAAQLFASVRKEIPDLEEQISVGNFAPVLEWLRKNIHAKGRLLPPDELIKAATGSHLSTEAFKAHLNSRYLDV